MEKYIIEDFKEDYPNIEFPYWEKVSSKETDSIIDRFFNLIQNESVTKENRLDKLYCILKEHPLSPMKYESIDLNILLESINVKKPEFVFINWYRMESLDKMKYQDFEKFIFDIWYGTDDIELFSSNLDWIIALTHYGTIKFVKI